MGTRVFIDGAAGTTGLQIAERLRRLAEVSLLSNGDAVRRDRSARLALMQEADLVVLCLPDEAAREAADMIEKLGSAAPKVLDASTAHRVAPGWVYGFPELSPEQPAIIAGAPRVSNPGCYATGAIALLKPLVASGILPPEHPLSIHGISGYSGGGEGDDRGPRT